MNTKKIIVIIVVILLSISIALLPVIASFATEEDHGMDAHSPTMSVGGEDESSRGDDKSEITESVETQSDDATITADAEEELDVAKEQSFFEAHKMQIIIGGSAVVLIIILAILIAANKNSKTKNHDKHYHAKH